MADNVTYANFEAGKDMVVTSALWQYDYGQILEIGGIELPQAFEAQFCNRGDTQTVSQIGGNNAVYIPDQFLLKPDWIDCFIYLHTGTDDGETVYKISIPVRTRQEPSDIQPTPVQQDVITETIAALNEAVDSVPASINAALAEAKASGEFDGPKGDPGNAIWTTEHEPSEYYGGFLPIYYYPRDFLIGRDSDVQIGDIIFSSEDNVYAVDWAGINPDIGDVCYVGLVGNIKGDTGADGNCIWWTNTAVDKDPAIAPNCLTGKSTLSGRTGVTPAVGDLVYAPPANSGSGNPTYLYRIKQVQSSNVVMLEIGSLRGATGATGADGADGNSIWTVNGNPGTYGTGLFPESYYLPSNLMGRDNVSAQAGDLIVSDNGIAYIADRIEYTEELGDIVIVSEQTRIEGTGVPEGGTTGQILKKSSATDYDTEWADLPTIDSALSDSSTNPVQNKVVTAALDEKADAVEQTASGAAASFSDGADGVPVKDLTVAIEPVQSGSGDPSPDNVRPISGWTGAIVTRTGKNFLNCLDAQALGIGTTIEKSSGEISVSNTSGTRYYGFNVWYTGIFQNKYLPLGTYRLSFDASGTFTTNWRAGCRNVSSNTFPNDKNISFSEAGHYSYTFTIDDSLTNDVYLSFCRTGNSTDNSSVTFSNIQLELSSTESTYEPYSGATIPISWQSEAGTVYGGTLDVTTGVLMVTHGAKALDGTETWVASTAAGVTNYYLLTWTNNHFMAQFVTGNTTLAGFNGKPLISHYKGVGYRDSSQMLDGESTTFNGANGQTLGIKDTTIASADAMKAYCLAQYNANTPVTFVLPLATPITYQLTPQEVKTLLGANNIWADTGDTTVQYRADTKLCIAAIEDENRQLQSSIAPTEDGATASQYIATGSYFYRNGELCVAISDISQGASFVLLDNYEEVILSDQILARNQGSSNAGKFMVVSQNGTVVPMTMETWQGGNY